MLFKRKDSPIWWVSFTVRGRRTRRSSGTTDKAQALELHDRWKSEAWREISLKEKPKLGWKEAALKWLEVKSAKATIHDDEAHLLFIQNFWKGKKLSEIGKEEIDSLKVKKKATGVSNATVNRMLSFEEHIGSFLAGAGRLSFWRIHARKSSSKINQDLPTFFAGNLPSRAI